MAKYDELIKKAIEELKDNDDLFVDCVNELDSWNGYADGFRGYPMYELNDLFYDCKVGDFLDKLASGFNHNDEYFVDTIYGLDSCDNLAEYYRDNVDEGELVDRLIEEYSNIDLQWIDSEFDELIESIVNYDEDEDTDED